jgi:protein-disulfide isomerase
MAVCSVTARAADGSRLKLPPGAKVAIVVFEDLQCPDCAKAYPVLRDAAKAYGIPLVLHEFPLPRHTWAFDGAVYARYFDAKSEKLGALFRSYVYQNRRDITASSLRQHAEEFARDNHLRLPAEVDPEGKFKQEVQADFQLARSLHLRRTPTIFVLRGETSTADSMEVENPAQLNQMVEEMMKKANLAIPSKHRAQE